MPSEFCKYYACKNKKQNLTLSSSQLTSFFTALDILDSVILNWISEKQETNMNDHSMSNSYAQNWNNTFKYITLLKC